MKNAFEVARITGVVETGVLRTMIDCTFDFEEAPQALPFVGTGCARAKVVITVP